ncbi:MFS transporter [Actinomadura keratinilytica]|uniref:MFS transporter n=1 Tax=Actinomadura keratinilytica TaxID=547461 RepID=UPI00361A88D5
MRASELRAILRGRDFRRLYGTRLTSQLTDGVFQVALAGYVFFSPERQTTAGKAAAAFAVTLLPYSALGPFAGVLIDRWRRRRILIWTPVVRALLTVLVAALVAAGQDGAVFFVTVLVVLGVNRFFLAALSAALPHVVRREHLVTANAFAVTSGTVIAFAGAGLGYLMRRVFGPHDDGTALILLGAAALWVAAALVAALLPRGLLGPHLDRAAPHTREALGNVLHGLADGARHMVANGPAALALAAISVHRFLYGIVLIMTLLLCRNHFTTDPGRGHGRVRGHAGRVGRRVLRRRADHAAGGAPRRQGRVDHPAAGGGGAALLALGLPFAQGPWVVGAFLLGVVSQGVKLCVDTTLQESIEDAYRGRVFAVYDMLFNAAFAAAAAVAATWLPADGVSHATLITVVAAYLVAAAAFRAGAVRLSRVPTTT